MIHDFAEILDVIANLYEYSEGDAGRAATFATACANIKRYAELRRDTSDVTVDEIRGIKGIGPSIVKIFEEFALTGECERLNTLLESCEDDDALQDYANTLHSIRENQIKRMKVPENAADAKAFILTGHPYAKKALSTARKHVKSLDDATKVFLAHALREDGYLPENGSTRLEDLLCEHCMTAYEEQSGDECRCALLGFLQQANAIGCSLPAGW